MQNPSDIELLCRLLGESDRTGFARVTSKTLAVAGEHGVLQLVAQRMTERGALAPGHELEGLVLWVNRMSAAAELLLTTTTRAALACLADSGIECLVLKGTALAHRYYPEPRLRPRTDVDLWIAPDAARHAADAFEARGFTLSNLDRRQLTSRQFKAVTEPVRGYPVTFDVHLAISNRAVFRDALRFEDSLETAQPLGEIGGRCPDTAALLMHACLHRIAHGRNAQGDRLLWLYDIHLLYCALSHEERDRFLRQALARGLGGTCAHGLRRGRSAFGTPVDDAFLAELESQAQAEPATQLLQAGRWSWLWSDLRGEHGFRRRARYLMEVIGNRAPLNRLAG